MGSKDSSEAEAFKHQQKEFEEQHHFMAEDYVKLLTSLEGQFKNISSGELKVIELTIPSVYKSLLNSWTCSNYIHENDSNFEDILEAISNEICSKVHQKM